MVIYILFIIIGFLLLIKGADFLVNGASKIAEKFKIPTIIIGLTIVAVGTSTPELMVSTTAALQNHADMSIGNVIGSNLINLFFILGICSTIKPLKFQKETEKFENIILVFATVLLLLFGNTDNYIINRIEGLILITCCILFILYNIFMAKKRKSDTLIELKEGKEKNISNVACIVNIMIGIIALKIGGDIVVKYASKIAIIAGLSEKIISVTIIALSTSLPEFITSIIATIKGETDMAIGNILGSQIFNIFLIIGLSAVLSPINYSINYNIDMYFLIFGTILFLFFPFTGKKHYMTRLNGVIFVIIYLIYLLYSILKVII